MWNFFEGVSKPKLPASKRSEGEKLAQAQKYEKTRKRSFQESWKGLWPWVYGTENVDGDSIMLCRVCVENKDCSDPGSNFVTGCTNFKSDTIACHEKTVKHQRAVQADEAKNAQPGSTPADRMLREMNKTHADKMRKLFLTTHALMKKGRPFTDFSWMCKLDKAKGVNIGDTYCNDKSCRTFAYYIAEAQRINLEDKAKKCRFYSLLSDGTTDSSVKEVEIMYLRTASQGVISNDFVGLISLEKANAVNICSGLLQCCKDQLHISENDLFSKMVGFGSDGASVMLGCNGGVSTLLKRKQKTILKTTTDILQSVHCFNHGLELGYKDALKMVAYQGKVHLLLENLYKFYHYSPLNRSMLKRSCDALNIKFLAPPRVGGTRWLPHMRRALDNLWVTYPAIIQHCQQLQNATDVGDQVSSDTKAKAKGFLELMMTKRFVLFGHFLTDIVLSLSKLSLKFQSSELYSASSMKGEVELVINKLESYRIKSGPYSRRVTELEGDGANTFHKLTLKAQSTGRLRGADNSTEAFHGDKVELINGLQRSLKNRFADCSIGVINALAFINLKEWPEKDDGSFGNEDIALLLDHYQPILQLSSVNSEEAEEEWSYLKHNIFRTTTYSQRQDPDKRPSWESINQRCQLQCPNILALVDLALTVPASNAQCEHGFSQMKIVKSDWRSSLTITAVTDILRVVLQTSDVGDYDPEVALLMWLKGGKRSKRPYIRPYGKRPKLATSTHADFSSSSSDSEEDEDESE